MTAATVNSNRSTIGRAAVLAACLLAGSLGVAQAAPAENLPQVAVSYSDLDLSSAAGVRQLYQRIAHAARDVCPAPDLRELAQVAANHTCREAAISRAVHEVNSPQLATLRDEHVKRG